jgi:N-methylhydantoinase B/oxoprolinase/acetone carboxylase alpha subunit
MNNFTFAGEPGRARVQRESGELIELGSTAQIEMGAGDVFILETPGGGGFGTSEALSADPSAPTFGARR